MLRRFMPRLPWIATSQPSQCTVRCLSRTPQLPKQLPPRPKVNEADIEEAFLKGSGPGGQKINKTSSAVQLKHLPTGIVIKCQATRSRSQNRKTARALLAEKLEFMEKGEESRIALRQDAKAKKAANRRKKAKRKYGKVEGSGGEESAAGEGEGAEKEVEGGTL